MHNRHYREYGCAEEGRELRLGEGGNEQAHPGGAHDIEQRAHCERQHPGLKRHLEDKHRHGDQREEIEHPDADVRHLLAEEKLQACDGRGIQVGDRAQLLLAHHAHRHQNRREED